MGLIRSEPGTVWRLTLDRPAARNAVTSAMLHDLVLLLGEAGLDPDARVIVLGGEGPDFCAGADLDELEAWVDDDELQEAGDYGEGLDRALRAIAGCPVPVLARVQGAALGAGCLLVAACDLVVAANGAQLGIPSARLGAALGSSIVANLVRTVGPGRATALLCGSLVISGAEAAAWGLVTEAVSSQDLDARVEDSTAQVAASAPLSVRAAKAAIRLGDAPEPDLDDRRTLQVEGMIAVAMASEDLAEGIRAFREGRPPEFRGR